MQIIPLTSRLIHSRERRNFMGIRALIGENDLKSVNDVLHTLYSDGMNIYLGGEIVENAFSDWIKPYSRIDLFAHTNSERNMAHFINMLEISSKEIGSEQWMHFGMITQKNVGWHVRDNYHGGKFYCIPVRAIQGLHEFRLESAIYDSSKPEPTPIHISFLSSLEGFDII